ncbi:MAG: hypothetical protein AAFN70_10575, partial [Planctomycetota bacterium]
MNQRKNRIHLSGNNTQADEQGNDKNEAIKQAKNHNAPKRTLSERDTNHCTQSVQLATGVPRSLCPETAHRHFACLSPFAS